MRIATSSASWRNHRSLHHQRRPEDNHRPDAEGIAYRPDSSPTRAWVSIRPVSHKTKTMEPGRNGNRSDHLMRSLFCWDSILSRRSVFASSSPRISPIARCRSKIRLSKLGQGIGNQSLVAIGVAHDRYRVDVVGGHWTDATLAGVLSMSHGALKTTSCLSRMVVT